MTEALKPFSGERIEEGRPDCCPQLGADPRLPRESLPQRHRFLFIFPVHLGQEGVSGPIWVDRKKIWQPRGCNHTRQSVVCLPKTEKAVEPLALIVRHAIAAFQTIGEKAV